MTAPKKNKKKDQDKKVPPSNDNIGFGDALDKLLSIKPQNKKRKKSSS